MRPGPIWSVGFSDVQNHSQFMEVVAIVVARKRNVVLVAWEKRADTDKREPAKRYSIEKCEAPTVCASEKPYSARNANSANAWLQSSEGSRFIRPVTSNGSHQLG